MSFFDDDPAEPRRRQPRQGPRTPSPGGRRPPPTDAQAVRRRQAIALGVGALVLILLVLGIKSCSTSAKERGLRDYNRSISALVQKSDADVSAPLFRLLNGAGGAGSGRSVELQNQVNNLKVEAEDQLKRAEALDVPDQATEAQRYALLTLELRRNGVSNIASLLQPALGGSDGGQAVQRIAGQMRNFDSSDVVWSQFAQPLIRKALTENGVNVGPDGEQIANSTFLKNGSWLDPSFVSDTLGSGGGANSKTAKPGTHGHGIVSTSVGNTTLNTAGVNRIPASPAPIFQVRVQNQGENDENNVRVQVRISGSGAPTTATKTIASTSAGQEATASVPLTKAPPKGSVVTVTVQVLPVAGEKKTDNNKQTYQVLFTS